MRPQFGIGKRLSLTVLTERENTVVARTWREDHSGAANGNRQFPVLIESVHVMDDANRIIDRVASSLVWLDVLNELQSIGVGNSLYFSLIPAQFVLRRRRYLEHRELNRCLVIPPILNAGEIPDDVIKAGSQVVDNLSAQNAKTQRDGEIAMIVNRLLPFLRIWIGNSWVFASVEKLAISLWRLKILSSARFIFSAIPAKGWLGASIQAISASYLN
ncbi:hypothetical protein [Tunturiibacter gelidiferens]|uniref:Uncharacterized protein n=1 Tax=Tunturiibacter gelidiferens TaxID=3069689 RepID=A0AAU7Z453_9BACT